MDQFKKLLKLVRIGKLIWQALIQWQICSCHAPCSGLSSQQFNFVVYCVKLVFVEMAQHLLQAKKIERNRQWDRKQVIFNNFWGMCDSSKELDRKNTSQSLPREYFKGSKVDVFQGRGLFWGQCIFPRPIMKKASLKFRKSAFSPLHNHTIQLSSYECVTEWRQMSLPLFLENRFINSLYVVIFLQKKSQIIEASLVQW